LIVGKNESSETRLACEVNLRRTIGDFRDQLALSISCNSVVGVTLGACHSIDLSAIFNNVDTRVFDQSIS
jgi:hypothetical protein